MYEDRTIEALASAWHRRHSQVIEDLWVSGDLDPDDDRAERQVSAWLDAGISIVIDLRQELCDEDRVAHLAPEITYVSLGAHDNGGAQPDDWFDKGLDVHRWAQQHGESVLVFSHMGVSRAPSMAFRLLIDQGFGAIEAGRIIRSARPISSLAYALDAFDHRARSRGGALWGSGGRNQLAQWLEDTAVDLPGIIRAIHRTASAWQE